MVAGTSNESDDVDGVATARVGDSTLDNARDSTELVGRLDKAAEAGGLSIAEPGRLVDLAEAGGIANVGKTGNLAERGMGGGAGGIASCGAGCAAGSRGTGWSPSSSIVPSSADVVGVVTSPAGAPHRSDGRAQALSL